MSQVTEPETHVDWKQAIAPYARPDVRRSALDILTSVVPFAVLLGVMYATLEQPYWVTLLMLVPAAGFLLRTYILFHDCTHGNFLPGKRANALLGRVLGVLVYTPYAAWRHSHAVHHATAGDLDRRGTGDVPMMTVAEYRAAPFKLKLGYRLFRNPFVMFVLGPFWAMGIGPRIFSRKQRPRIRNSILLTNLALAGFVGAQIYLVGLAGYLSVWAPLLVIAGGSGIFLFYVQHQYEDAYWEDTASWSYADAALQGSSYLELPRVLQFFTGNIGLHHVHHLSAKVPNYNLQRAHDELPIFHDVPVLTLADGVRCTRLKLWDEDRGRLVTWAEAAQRPHGEPEPAAAIA